MNIKLPPAYDTSHWRTIPDFALLNPAPLLIITKATEADNYTDKTFIPYMADIKKARYFRGCFHFHRKAVHASLQASHFINTIAPVIDSRDILALDVEEGGETAQQLIDFLKAVRAAFSNIIMIYSRKNILDPIISTLAQREYLKQFPTWTAGYPWFPDNYNTCPPAYVPDILKWGPVALWQYTSKAPVAGVVEGVLDANWIAPWFLEIITPTPPPPPPTIVYPTRVDLVYESETKPYVPE